MNLQYLLTTIAIVVTSTLSVYAQNQDLDSLLVALNKDYQLDKDPAEIIAKAKNCLKLAPEYIDYNFLIGQNYEKLNQGDSATAHYKKVISKNNSFPEAYHNLIRIQMNVQDYSTALDYLKTARRLFPNNPSFDDAKRKEIRTLKKIQDARTAYDEENSKAYGTSFKREDRIGVQYTRTDFDRDDYGPWNQYILQYAHTRKWGAIIANLNTMERKLPEGVEIKGTQYELSSYIATSQTNYFLLNAALSNDLVYPKYRLGASYYISFLKVWEANLGVRYTRTSDDKIPALVVGLGKYYKALWFNVNGYFQTLEDKINPAVTFTTRYYLGDRYDYLFGIVGYGTSPDDKNLQGLYTERLSLNSYRAGVGLSKTIFKHFITGIQFIYNNQEYIKGMKQNEFESTISLQYKF